MHTNPVAHVVDSVLRSCESGGYDGSAALVAAPRFSGTSESNCLSSRFIEEWAIDWSSYSAAIRSAEVGAHRRSTLKKDLVHRVRFRSWAGTRVQLFDFIEMFYNPKRRHSFLGGCSPIESEWLTERA